MQLYTVKYLNCLRTRKYKLEHKWEWKLSLVLLFLPNVTFYLNCLDRVVLAHPFWELATFQVSFSVLSCWTHRAPSMSTKWSSWIGGGGEAYVYVTSDDYFVSVGLQWTNRKIGKFVTPYQREMLIKIPHLGTICTQSIHEGLRRRNQSTIVQLAYTDFYHQLLKLHYSSNKSRLNPTDKIIPETGN